MGIAGKQVDLNDYERLRNARIAKNNTRLEEFGILSMAKKLTSSAETSRSSKSKRKEKAKAKANIDQRGVEEYIPNFSSESDEEDNLPNETVIREVNRSGGKQQVRYIPPRSTRNFTNNAKHSDKHDFCDKIQIPQIDTKIDCRQTSERQPSGRLPAMSKNNAQKMTMCDLILKRKQNQSTRVGGKTVADRLFSESYITDGLQDGLQGLEDYSQPNQMNGYEAETNFDNLDPDFNKAMDTTSDSDRENSLHCENRSLFGIDDEVPQSENEPTQTKCEQDLDFSNLDIILKGKDWVLKTIGAAWRVHKYRFKKTYYHAYEDDKTRWKNRPKRVPDEDFLKLLRKWKKNDVKIRCSRNRDCRLRCKNVHTAGPKSFARIREEMKNQHPNKEPPSLAELFERTRRRNEGKTYKESYDDTAKKIEDMKNYVPPEDGSGSSNAFFGVMGEEYDGRYSLYGRGVCSKKLKKMNGMSSYVVPQEVIESVKVNLFEEMRKEVDWEIIKLNDMRKDMQEEHLKKQTELENMKLDIENDRENMKEAMTEQILTKILEKLPLDIARQYLSRYDLYFRTEYVFNGCGWICILRVSYGTIFTFLEVILILEIILILEVRFILSYGVCF